MIKNVELFPVCGQIIAEYRDWLLAITRGLGLPAYSNGADAIMKITMIKNVELFSVCGQISVEYRDRLLAIMRGLGLPAYSNGADAIIR